MTILSIPFPNVLQDLLLSEKIFPDHDYNMKDKKKRKTFSISSQMYKWFKSGIAIIYYESEAGTKYLKGSYTINKINK